MRFELSGLYSPQRRDVYDSNNKSTMYFYPSSLNGCTLKVINNGSSDLTYRRAYLYLNDVLVAKVSFSYENRWNGQSESAGVATHVLSAGAEYTYTLDNSSHNIDAGWGYEHVYYTQLTSNNVTFNSAGTYHFKLVLFSDYNATNQVASYFYSLVDVIAYAPQLSSILATGGTRSFYKNGTFNTNGLVVTGYWKYQVATEPGSGQPSIARESNVTSSCSFSSPDMTTAGSKRITVTYQGKTATYSINVYGASIKTNPSIAAFYKAGSSKPTANAVIQYGNGVEETKEVTWEWDNSVGENRSFTWSVTATETGEVFTGTMTATLCDYSLSLTTTNVKKRYAYNATSIDTTNLVVKRVWGNGIDDETISSFEASFGESWDVGKDTGSIVISDGTKSVSYSVNVDGLAYISIDTSSGKTLFGKGEQFSKNGIKVNYTEYEDGETDDKGEWSGNPGQNPETISTSETGVQTITLSISKNGKTVSESYDIAVYEHKSLVLTNTPTDKYIVNGVAPKMALSKDFSVTAKCEYGETAWDNNSPYYSVSPAIGSDLVEGDNLITITSYYDEGKTVIGATATFQIHVSEDYPTEDATISVIGSLSQSIFLKNQTVSLEGITIKVSKTLSGLTNTNFDDYDVQLVLHSDSDDKKDKNDLTFTDNDTLGYYDLVISIDGVTAIATIENAVCFKGLTSVSYDETRENNGYFVNATTKVSNSNRVKVGDILNKAWIKFRKHYSDNTYEDVFDSSFISSIKANNTEKTKVMYADNDDEVSNYVPYTITINGSTFVMNVPFIYVSSLSLTNTKTAYDIHDELDTSKITLKKVYSNSTQENLTINDVSVSFTSAGTGCAINNLIPSDLRQSASVSVGFSYQEGDAPSVSATSVITVKAIRSVALRDDNANTIIKIAYEYGQTHSLSGYYLYVVFNTTETLTVAIDDTFTYAKKGERISTDTAISATIGYTYHNDTVNTNYTIHCHYLSDISVDFSSVSGSNLFQYDTLDVSDITGTKTIVSTDEEDSSYPMTSDITDDLTFTFNGQNVSKDTGYYLGTIGTFNLNAYYSLNGQAISKTQALTIVAVELQSISLTKSASFKELSTYIEEQYLDLSGLTINIVYNKSASNHSISYTDPNITIVDSNDIVYPKTKGITLADDDVELFVKYSEYGTTKYASIGTLSVAAKEIASIRIRQNPSKTEYYYGDTFTINGIVVEAVFNNGNTEIIPVSSLSVSGIALGHVFNPSDDGTTFEEKSATISYTRGSITKSVTLNYTLLTPVLSYLKHNVNDINEPVVKRFTDGDTFTYSGLLVTAVFTNGYEEVLGSTDYSLNTSALYLDGNGKIQLHDNNQDYGSKTVIITGVNPYNQNDSKTVSYDVEVVTTGAIISAVLQLTDDYNKYLVGEAFTAKGVSFKVTDIDDNIFTVTNFTTSIERGSIFRSAQRMTVTATYVNGSYSKEEKFEILVSIPNKIELTDENTYRLAIGLDTGDLIESLEDTDGKEITFGKKYDMFGNLTAEIYPLFHEDRVSVDDNPLHTDTYGYNVYTGDNAQNDFIGYIDLGIADVRKAHVVLFNDPVNPIDGDGNIEVTFPHYVSGYADRINRCRFGKVFHNRLFVSGNPDYKSADFHSGDVNVGQIKQDYKINTKGDYSYFSDLDYCYYGNDETAVVGYDEYRDGDLIVIKEGSRNQATLYRREYKLVEATSYDGNKVGDNLYEEAFPMFDINSNGGVGGISHRAVANFVGETLVLTRNGLKAITNKESVFNNAKYTFDVSTYINPKIVHEDLDKAIIFTFDEKLILKTNRGVYVGYYEIRNEGGEYEWYFLDNINADIFFECENELYFANDFGDICRFSTELLKYKDQERTFVGVGGALLQIDESNDSLVVSATYANKVKENNPFHVITTHSVGGVDKKSLIHASLGLFVDEIYRGNMIGSSMFDQTIYVGLIDRTNNQLTIKPYTSDGVVDQDRLNAIRNLFFSGRKVYIDLLTGAGVYSVNVDQEYELVKVDTGNDLDNVFELYDEWGEKVSLSGIETMRMSFAVNDLSITKITDISDYGTSGAKKFKLLGDHDQVLDLINYNQNLYTYAGVITNEDNVKAYYETAPYAMGSIVSSKTIWSWTIVNDTALAGYMDIGYFASRKQGDYNYSIRSVPDSNGFDFGRYSWSTLDFTSRKLPITYSIQRSVPSIAYIRYLFKNFEDSNIVLTSLNIVYTIANLLEGVN